jgi:hypothetical protein
VSTPAPIVTATEPPVVEATTASITPTGVAPSASALAHPLQGNENCLACHAVSSTIEPAPPHHAGFTIELCQDCHLLAATEPPPTATPEAATAPPAAGIPVTPTLPLTHSLTIPHPVAAWADCLSCHAPEEGVDPMPLDHATFQNNMCQMCHLPAQEQS